MQVIVQDYSVLAMFFFQFHPTKSVNVASWPCYGQKTARPDFDWHMTLGWNQESETFTALNLQSYLKILSPFPLLNKQEEKYQAG